MPIVDVDVCIGPFTYISHCLCSSCVYDGTLPSIAAYIGWPWYPTCCSSLPATTQIPAPSPVSPIAHADLRICCCLTLYGGLYWPTVVSDLLFPPFLRQLITRPRLIQRISRGPTLNTRPLLNQRIYRIFPGPPALNGSLYQELVVTNSFRPSDDPIPVPLC